jgi:hypothetical protein
MIFILFFILLLFFFFFFFFFELRLYKKKSGWISLIYSLILLLFIQKSFCRVLIFHRKESAWHGLTSLYAGLIFHPIKNRELVNTDSFTSIYKMQDTLLFMSILVIKSHLVYNIDFFIAL